MTSYDAKVRIIECKYFLQRGYDYEILEYFGDAIIALLSRFETVLFNQKFNENELDQERLKNESNLFFK